MQTRLLRTLEERCIQRLGDSREIPVDVRVISATHRDLAQAIAQNAFREDLFYRLNTVVIRVPPLREHPEDIEPLAEHFLRLYAGETGKQLTSFSPAASESLRAHPFPGNVRELRNVVERAAIFADAATISDGDLEFRRAARAEGSQETHIDAAKLPDLNLGGIEKILIVEALSRSQGSLSGAGRLLGISREMVRTRMKNHRIEAS
jgi:DNA-binding NtrC family response regulator